MADASQPEPADGGPALRPVSCQNCRARKTFCDRAKPTCSYCKSTNKVCEYKYGRNVSIAEATLHNLREQITILETKLQAYEESNAGFSAAQQPNADAHASQADTQSDLGPQEAEGVRAVFTGLAGLTIDPSGQARAHYYEATAADGLVRRISNIAGVEAGAFDFTTQQYLFNHDALRLNRQPPPITFFLPPLPLAKQLYHAQYSMIGTIFAFSNPAEFELHYVEALQGSPNVADSEACLRYAKVLTILAFGRLYSVNQLMSYDGPPGYEFFCQALQLLPGIHEGSSPLFVETLALVGYYMMNLGQRDSAFLYVGTALRMAIGLALHQEVNNIQLDDYEREHRRRVWWSVYSMDRILTIKNGHPIMVHDEDIGVKMPSQLPHEPEYSGWTVLDRYTQLSRILTRIMHDVYRSSEKTGSGLMTSVQGVLASLSEWHASIPDELKFNADKLDFTRESISTFLHYFQCINMTVRPLLFLVVERRMKWTAQERTQDWRHGLSAPTIHAIKTCIDAAQDTIAMVAIAAKRNLYATYGWMDAEHCFGAAIVLVLACLAFPYNEPVHTSMDSALSHLQMMVDRAGGNSVIAPRLQLLSQIRSRIQLPGDVDQMNHFSMSPGGSNNTLYNSQLSTMMSNFPHVNNETLGELLLESSPGDLSFWEEAYPVQGMEMRLESLQQYTQPPAPGAEAGSL